MNLKHATRFIKAVPMMAATMPIMKSVHAYDGRIQIGNLNVAVDLAHKPFAGMEFTAPLDQFMAAANACGDTEPSITVDPEDLKMTVRHKSFKATMPLYAHDNYPRLPAPTFSKKAEGVKIVDTLKLLKPFAGNPGVAIHHWQNGICFRDGYAYATNNASVVRAELPLGIDREVTVNLDMIDTITAIGEEPDAISIDENFIAFHYHSGAWIRCRLIENGWPHSIDDLLNSKPAQEPVPEGLLDSLSRMAPFTKDDAVIGGPDGVSTEEHDSMARDEDFKLPTCAYKMSELIDVLKVADKFDFSKYPNSPWSGTRVRGITAGRRL